MLFFLHFLLWVKELVDSDYRFGCLVKYRDSWTCLESENCSKKELHRLSHTKVSFLIRCLHRKRVGPWKFLGYFQEMSGKCPGNVREISDKFQEISGKLQEISGEISRKFPGSPRCSWFVVDFHDLSSIFRTTGVGRNFASHFRHMWRCPQGGFRCVESNVQVEPTSVSALCTWMSRCPFKGFNMVL